VPKRIAKPRPRDVLPKVEEKDKVTVTLLIEDRFGVAKKLVIKVDDWQLGDHRRWDTRKSDKEQGPLYKMRLTLKAGGNPIIVVSNEEREE
jgi:hypothetical protein